MECPNPPLKSDSHPNSQPNDNPAAQLHSELETTSAWITTPTSKPGPSVEAQTTGIARAVGRPPTTSSEIEFWRAEFAKRPYAKGHRFEELESAYRGAVDIFGTYRPTRSRTFEAIEPALRERWMTEQRGRSTLEWSEVRDASRDAWNRIAQLNGAASTPRPAEAKVMQPDEGNAAQLVNEIVVMLHDTAEGFRDAADRVQNSMYRDTFRGIEIERREFIAELRSMIALRGEKPAHSGTLSGAWQRIWSNLRTALVGGDDAIASACESSEDEMVRAYHKLLTEELLTPQFREVLWRQYGSIKGVHDTLLSWKRASDERASAD